MSQAEMNPNTQSTDDAIQSTDDALSDEQLTDVSGGLSGRIKEEFEDGLGNKRLSTSLKDEFVKGTDKESSENS